MAEVNFQLCQLEGHAQRGDKPRCKAGVHTGTGCQSYWRHQLIAVELGPTLTVGTGGDEEMQKTNTVRLHKTVKVQEIYKNIKQYTLFYIKNLKETFLMYNCFVPLL